MAEEKEKQPEQFSADFLIKTVDEGMKQGRRFCFIIGAGASMSSGIKSGQELGYLWLKELEDDGRLEMLKQPADILYNNEQMQHPYDEIIKAFNEGKERRKMPSEYYFDAYKLRFYPDNSLGFAELERIMSHTYPSFAYFCMARFLAKYNSNCNLVITTNFDNLVEDALFIYTDQKPLVVNHESLAEYAVNPYIKRPIVAKVHRGLFFDPLNDKAETDQLKGKWKSVLSYLFTSYTPIIIGYGGGDHSLMALLQDESVQFRGRFYWCSYKDEALNDPVIRKLVLDKNGVFVETDGFDNVMLKFGNAMFREEILPNAVMKYLENQNNAWITKYTEGFNRASKAESKDAEALKTAEIVDTEKRDKDEKLTKWDYKQRGDDKNEAGDYTGAMAEYNKALEIDPDFTNGYNGLGWSYYGIKQYDKAIANYNKAIELDPSYAAAYSNRGNAYGILGQYDKAIEDHNKAIELDPNFASAYYNRGNIYYYLQQYYKAITEYSKAIELDPNYAAAYYNRGNAYYNLQQYNNAIVDYSKAIELDPNYAVAYNNRGNVYCALQQYDKAIADLNKAIELDPNFASAYYNCGNAYQEVKQYDKAIEEYNNAIKLDLNDTYAYNNCGLAYYYLSQYDKAIADYTKAIELDPNYANAYNNRGLAYNALKQYDKALADYNKAIELDPNYTRAYSNRADAYDAIGETELAAADRAKAEELEVNQ